MPKKSIRLSLIADLVPNGAKVADIGTDHGYLAIELIKSGKAKSVIASDIGEKPLENAKKNIEKANVSGISLRLCDGLKGYKTDEVDTVIIAGMGGEVISGILSRNEDFIKDTEKIFILQPTTSPEFLRKYLLKTGFKILSETPIYENNKLYSVLLVRFTGKILNETPGYYYIGEVIPNTQAGLLYIEKQKNRCFECLAALENIKKKQNEYNFYKSAFDYIEAFLKNYKENLSGV